jgi:transposase
MIQITPQMRIFLAVEPADFRKGIDGLAQVCRQVLGKDPFSGYLFIFRNKRANAIKVLMYDGQGLWLCQKRLSKGRFTGWPGKDGSCTRQLAVHELQLLIWNGDLGRARVGPLWKPIDLPVEKNISKCSDGACVP